MRILTKGQQDMIINDLYNEIPKMGFDFTSPKIQIEIISGSDEGFFLWMAINYQLGRFNSSRFFEVTSLKFDFQ